MWNGSKQGGEIAMEEEIRTGSLVVAQECLLSSLTMTSLRQRLGKKNGDLEARSILTPAQGYWEHIERDRIWGCLKGS